jgi:Fe-Mn family superoxide dismutase
MFHLPTLPSQASAVSNWLSQEALGLHYGKHHRGYIQKLNELLLGSGLEAKTLEEIVRRSSGPLFNNAAQAWNHTFYWLGLGAVRKSSDAFFGARELRAALESSFGSTESFLFQFRKSALELFGSGWVWLASDSNERLQIVQTKDADNPLTAGMRPLLTCDVWEHAYYVDHKNERAHYLDGFMSSVKWTWVNQQLVKPNAHEVSDLMFGPRGTAVAPDSTHAPQEFSI